MSEEKRELIKPYDEVERRGPREPRFTVGTRVTFVNDYGVSFTHKIITEVVLNPRPGCEIGYRWEGMDTPWFPTAEENLFVEYDGTRLAKLEELAQTVGETEVLGVTTDNTGKKPVTYVKIDADHWAAIEKVIAELGLHENSKYY